MYAWEGNGGGSAWESCEKGDRCCKSYGPLDLNFPKLFFHQLSEGSRGRFAIKHFFGVGMIGVGEDGTMMGRKEVNRF